MLAPRMLGLNTPEQDLHYLSEFGKWKMLELIMSFIPQKDQPTVNKRVMNLTAG